jgi:putative transposase
MTEKRTFTKEEKLLILKEVEQEGVKSTLEKHGIYPATYYSWNKKFEQMGKAGFQHGMTPAHIKEIKRLEKENKLLKKLLAEKETEGHLKTEMLKKNMPGREKRIGYKILSF